MPPPRKPVIPVTGISADRRRIPPTGARPPIWKGQRDSTLVTVGAHQKHVAPQNFTPQISHPFPCSECHVLPSSVQAAGHVGHAPSSGVRRPPGDYEVPTTPHWSHSNATCTATYCHGNWDLGNPNNPPPLWTPSRTVLRWFAGTCHSIPPPASTGHPDSSRESKNCNLCHSSVIGTDNVTIVNPTLHVNGEANFN